MIETYIKSSFYQGKKILLKNIPITAVFGILPKSENLYMYDIIIYIYI